MDGQDDSAEVNKRYVIAYEEKQTVPGQYLEAGSIKWDENAMVPIIAHEKDDKLLGIASNIQRDEHGVLTAEVTQWLDENYRVAVEADDLALTIYCNEVTARQDDELGRVVSSARLRALYPTVGVPWAKYGYGNPRGLNQ